jgi:uncharacterized protein YndB with AHSA1/START domain
MSPANLATFLDRHTMRHVRIYAHPIERVWEAITDDEQVSKWMGFPVRFDLREGGICKWGGDASYWTSKIVRLEPPTLMEHEGLRFELFPHPDGTRFEFTQSFAAGRDYGGEVPDDLGGDLPGGLDTPWRPGFVGGFHTAFDGLGEVLAGRDPIFADRPDDELFNRLVDHWVKLRVEQDEMPPEEAERIAAQFRGVAVWNELNVAYREHIRNTIPKQ